MSALTYSTSVAMMTVRDGLGIAVETSRREDAPTVILLHGGGQTRRSWARTAQALLAERYTVVTFDARGHGDSDWATDGDYSAAAQGRDLSSILAGYDPDRTALVGASMGAVTALFHASGGGPPPAALVLVDMVLQPIPGSSQRFLDFMTGNPDGFGSPADAATAIQAFNPMRPKIDDASRLLPNLRVGQDGRYRWHWDPRLFGDPSAPAMPDNGWMAERIAGRITSPTLLIRGDRSEVVDETGVEHMRELIPHLETAMVYGAGHMVAGDSNHQFNSALIRFLNQLQLR